MVFLVGADGGIYISALAAAGLIAAAGAGLLGLAVAYRQGEMLYRAISAMSGAVLLVFAGSLALPPLAGVVALTLTTAGIYVGVTVAYLSGATEPEAEDVPRDVPQPAPPQYAFPEGRRARSFTLPVNTSLALSLKSETWKPEGRLTL